MINEIKVGKIHDFDGESGYIITDELKYPFANKDVYEDIKNGDIVSFIPNVVVFGNEKTYVARFIKKYNLENENIHEKIKKIKNEIER